MPYDVFINPLKKQALNDTRAQIKEMFERKFFFADDLLTNPENSRLLYSILWRTGADGCDTLIKQCKIQGMEKPCTELFHLLPTISGPCCTFNAMDDMYRNSAFSLVT